MFVGIDNIDWIDGIEAKNIVCKITEPDGESAESTGSHIKISINTNNFGIDGIDRIASNKLILALMRSSGLQKKI